MDIFHHTATDATKEAVAKRNDLKLFVTELCHTFGVKVISHDYELHANDRMPIDDGRFAHRILLATEDCSPFGSATITKVKKRNGHGDVDAFEFVSAFIDKERGRGEDSNARWSVSMKALIKQLKRDIEEAKEVDINGNKELPNYVLNNLDSVLSSLKAQIDEAHKINRYGTMITPHDDILRAILLAKFENAPLPPEVDDWYKRAYEKYTAERAKKDTSKETYERFIKQFYVVGSTKYTGALVGIFQMDENRNVTVHQPMKPYTSLEAIAEDYPNLITAIKMFSIKHEANLLSAGSAVRHSPYYEIINKYLTFDDQYDSDLDVFTDRRTIGTGFSRFGSINWFMTPTGNV